jgi:lipopolysaccharide/colanic/teichoic acid biosynthesis glycosyltransferase
VAQPNGVAPLWRAAELLLSLIGLVVTSPLLAICAAAIWVQDRHSPFYLAPRIGIGGREFTMFKLRTMRVASGKSEIDSTAADDPRLTAAGRFVRRLKLDEFPQLLNVVTGTMRLVGPRPQVAREVAIYTIDERRLLTVLPGVTDLASIVFSDLQEILAGVPDPNLGYGQLVRPWKSRLGLLYIDHRNAGRDIAIIWLTIVNIVARRRALSAVEKLVREMAGSDELVRVCSRREPLTPSPPPGARTVVISRTQAPV